MSTKPINVVLLSYRYNNSKTTRSNFDLDTYVKIVSKIIRQIIFTEENGGEEVLICKTEVIM